MARELVYDMVIVQFRHTVQIDSNRKNAKLFNFGLAKKPPYSLISQMFVLKKNRLMGPTITAVISLSTIVNNDSTELINIKLKWI